MMVAGTYARRTKVPVSRSKAELERTLERYGADQFRAGWDKDRSIIEFRCRKLMVRFEITNEEDEADQRQSWRGLVLIVKAKLVAIETGVSTFEQEFFAWMVGPGGRTLGEQLIPQLANMKTMPLMLPAPENETKLLPIDAGRA